MASTTTSWSWEWLAGTETQTLHFDRGWKDLRKVPIPLPPGWGTGEMELFHLGQGIDLARTRLTFEAAADAALIAVGGAKGSVPEPMFGLYSVHRGVAVLKDRRSALEAKAAAGSAYVHHVDKLDFEILVEAKGKFEGSVVTVGSPVLAQLLGPEAADQLLSKLGLERVPSGTVHPLPPDAEHLLRETLPDNLSGNMRILFSQAKTLECLCALSMQVEAFAAPVPGRAAIQDAVETLKVDLTKLSGRVPLLGELAVHYGFSARTLNDEFRRQFGVSIYMFLNNFRLEEAFAALKQSDIPMKAIAANIGYSHVNHFIHAFRKKYGYPPGQLRR